VDGIEFRHINGTGNNVDNPIWGLQKTPLVNFQTGVRFYQGLQNPNDPNSASPMDGLDPTLPPCRTVSNVMNDAYGSFNTNDILINQMHLDWGHFVVTDILDVDVNRSGLRGAVYGEPLDPKDYMADESWGADAPFAQCSIVQVGVLKQCQNVARFNAIPRTAAVPGTGVGTNEPKKVAGDVSHWLDLSQIYGNPVRPQFQMKEYATPWFDVDPLTQTLLSAKINPYHKPAGYDGTKTFFPTYPRPTKWITAGDFRYNKTPGLRILSEVFIREHNRLVDEFSVLHPEWSTLRLFHEARKWTIAYYQSLTFREYLAAGSGTPLPPYVGYDPTINPTVDDFFGSVAMRYGHSGLPSLVPLLDGNLNECPYGAILAKAVFNPGSWEIPNTTHPFTRPDGTHLFGAIGAGRPVSHSGRRAWQYAHGLRPGGKRHH
jgi:hypothetical protein